MVFKVSITNEWIGGGQPLGQGMTFARLGTGTGMALPIPELWEQERE